MRLIPQTGELLLDSSVSALLALALALVAVGALTRPYADRRPIFLIASGVGVVVPSTAMWQLLYTSNMPAEDWPISPGLSMCAMLGAVVAFFAAGALELRTHPAHALTNMTLGTGSLALAGAFGWHATGYLDEVAGYAAVSWLLLAAVVIWTIAEIAKAVAQSRDELYALPSEE